MDTNLYCSVGAAVRIGLGSMGSLGSVGSYFSELLLQLKDFLGSTRKLEFPRVNPTTRAPISFRYSTPGCGVLRGASAKLFGCSEMNLEFGRHWPLEEEELSSLVS